MRKIGGSSEGFCLRCKFIAGDCHCVRNASRHVNHKEESDRDIRNLDDIVRDIEEKNFELFDHPTLHIGYRSRSSYS